MGLASGWWPAGVGCVAFEQEGELSAGVELRRLFPSITDGARVREMARVIGGVVSIAQLPALHNRDLKASNSRSGRKSNGAKKHRRFLELKSSLQDSSQMPRWDALFNHSQSFTRITQTGYRALDRQMWVRPPSPSPQPPPDRLKFRALLHPSGTVAARLPRIRIQGRELMRVVEHAPAVIIEVALGGRAFANSKSWVSSLRQHTELLHIRPELVNRSAERTRLLEQVCCILGGTQADTPRSVAVAEGSATRALVDYVARHFAGVRGTLSRRGYYERPPIILVGRQALARSLAVLRKLSRKRGL